MRVRACTRRTILEPCSLEGHAYQIDPYIGCEHRCSYCYALNQAETDWRREVLTFKDIAAQVSDEIAGLESQNIYMGWNSDPYQPCEGNQRQTRHVLELLADSGFSVCILTKSGLVARDVDLLAVMPDSSAGVSIAFQDERVRQLFEEAAPPNEVRTGALEALRDAGVRTYALICPVMPFISDVTHLVGNAARCADTIWIYALSMDSEDDPNWRDVRRILDKRFPELAEPYRQIAPSSSHPYWEEQRRCLEILLRESGLDLRIKL